LEVLRYRRYIGKAQWQESYGVLIISRHDEPRWVCLGPAEVIEKSIKLYQHAVRGPDASGALVQVLRDLHDIVWSPVIPQLPARKRRIIVSPDGELNFVSFATLLTPANHFLGEKFLFSYVACARDLLAENKPAPGEPGFLVWANPDFDLFPGDSESFSGVARGGEFRGLSFPSLPGAEKEANMLRARARQLGVHEAVFNVGAKATEAELYRLRSPKVLHLATHAFFLAPIKSINSTEADYSEAENPKSVVPTFNPMRRSGLALAGAQRTLQRWRDGNIPPTQNDGIVTAEEIAGLDLRGTWLVVLSACNTGMGEAQAGEGVLGLRRGFVQAGAQNLLLTLWPIDDQNSLALLGDFYAELGRSNSPPLALARAQSSWLERLRIEKGAAEACRLAGPFILSFQGRP
jgi:CHAT domain-containing protein